MSEFVMTIHFTTTATTTKGNSEANGNEDSPAPAELGPQKEKLKFRLEY